MPSSNDRGTASVLLALEKIQYVYLLILYVTELFYCRSASHGRGGYRHVCGSDSLGRFVDGVTNAVVIFLVVNAFISPVSIMWRCLICSLERLSRRSSRRAGRHPTRGCAV